MAVKTFTLERVNLNADSTEGNLRINGAWFCHVVEDAVRAEPGQWHSSKKIKHKTAIPYGRYRLSVTYSPRFKRMLTAILGVPDFTGIRIHNGVNAGSSSGCPIVSYTAFDISNSVKNDPAAMNDLCRIVADEEKKGPVYIDVIKK